MRTTLEHSCTAVELPTVSVTSEDNGRRVDTVSLRG